MRPARPASQSVVLQGRLYSPNCGYSLEVNGTALDVAAAGRKALSYSLAASGLSLLQLWLISSQVDHTSTPAAAAKVSLLMVAAQALLDAYLCLAHTTAALVLDQLFNPFATAAFFEFVVFAVAEMRCATCSGRGRRRARSWSWWQWGGSGAAA